MSKWEPIETAPKDGRVIRIGWLPNGVLEVVDKTRWLGDHWEGWFTPTHWQPYTAGSYRQPDSGGAK